MSGPRLANPGNLAPLARGPVDAAAGLSGSVRGGSSPD